MTAMIAQTPSAPDHRDIELWAIIAVMMRTGCGVFHPYLYGACLDPYMRAPKREKAAFFLGRLPDGRHSLRSEAPITNPRFIAFSREVVTNSLDEKRIKSEILEPGSEGPEPDKL